MRKKLIAGLCIVLIFVFSFIYVTAFGISQLSNEKVLFLFLDETKGDPGTIEIANLAIFKDARLQQDLIKINPLLSTEQLKREGIFLSDCLIKAKSLEEGLHHAQTIAEQQTKIPVDRIVLINASVLKTIVDSVHPIPVDKQFTVTVLGESFNLHAKVPVTGSAAERCVRGEEYPGIDNEALLEIPEDYLWEVKSEIIGDVTKKLLDLSQYNTEERNSLAYTLVEQYRNDHMYVYKRNAVLILVYYLPEPISKQIVSFAVRRIV